MRVWINYHHLLYFKVIAEEGSVSRAAEILRLGQPTLSAQLKQFEQNLGVQLFERKHKKLILTEQGKIALDYAKSIFEQGNEMYEALQDKLVPTRVSLQIGALDSIPKQIMLRLTKAAYKVGNCQVSLVEGKAEEILRELIAHRVDLFLTNFIPSALESRRLVHRSIVKSPVSIYGSARFRHLRKNFPQSLKGQPIVMPTYDSQLRYDLEHWSKTQGLFFDIIAETQDTSLKNLMALDGLGLIPATPSSIAWQVAAKKLFPIGILDGVSEELFLVSAQRRRENPIAAQLMKTFRI